MSTRETFLPLAFSLDIFCWQSLQPSFQKTLLFTSTFYNVFFTAHGTYTLQRTYTLFASISLFLSLSFSLRLFAEMTFSSHLSRKLADQREPFYPLHTSLIGFRMFSASVVPNPSNRLFTSFLFLQTNFQKYCIFAFFTLSRISYSQTGKLIIFQKLTISSCSGCSKYLISFSLTLKQYK